MCCHKVWKHITSYKCGHKYTLCHLCYATFRYCPMKCTEPRSWLCFGFQRQCGKTEFHKFYFQRQCGKTEFHKFYDEQTEFCRIKIVETQPAE